MLGPVQDTFRLHKNCKYPKKPWELGKRHCLFSTLAKHKSNILKIKNKREKLMEFYGHYQECSRK